MPSNPDTGQAVSIRSVLREQTDDIHQLLHRHSSFAALFEQRLNQAEYLQLMQRLMGFYEPLDDAIEALIKTGDGPLRTYRYARRSNLLQRDLLSLELEQRAIDSLPRCSQVAHLATPKTLGGILYVIEGATLGGSVIERALSKTLKSGGADGMEYWAWCRAEGKHCWSQLNAYLDDLAVDEGVLERHLTGAQETFRIFAEWLEPLNRSDAPSMKMSA